MQYKDKGFFISVNFTFFGLPFTASSIVLERYFQFEISLLSILCILIAQMEMGTSRVSGDFDIIT